MLFGNCPQPQICLTLMSYLYSVTDLLELWFTYRRNSYPYLLIIPYLPSNSILFYKVIVFISYFGNINLRFWKNDILKILQWWACKDVLHCCWRGSWILETLRYVLSIREDRTRTLLQMKNIFKELVIFFKFHQRRFCDHDTLLGRRNNISTVDKNKYLSKNLQRHWEELCFNVKAQNCSWIIYRVY